MKRVVVTGMAGITSLGSDWATIAAAMAAGRTGIRRMPEWAEYRDLNTQLAGPVTDFALPAHYTRKQTRSMGRVAQLAVVASERALASAGLLGRELIRSGKMGVAFGSSIGSTSAVREFGEALIEKDVNGLNANSYLRMMSHTTAVNVGVHFGLKGRVIPTSSACTSGSQGIGYAFEAIRYGQQTLMIAGGAEELCPTEAMVFDTLYATSTRNDTPALTPRPFDLNRDGLVIGEGAGALILEEYEHAQARGATILAEIVGFACNSDGAHVTKPESATMEVAMRLALRDAGLQPADIGYVSLHGTATEQGDIAESQATARVFGNAVPASSLKGYFGHTLGACGALEAWLSIEMLNSGWFAGNVNLDQPDPACGALDYLPVAGRELHCRYIMSNNFAFGGINTSLIFKRSVS
ncbi:beta-ketoacyl-ACP synthase [Chitinilyticum piscinae]|uniref:Beta-ketoacyl-ACP synthase n=1 Tax=Chitinilyticum piscinae TaxID=2866724 RepID=A0A8J7FI65_9NEIS|nr:beta-ketoacyl-ACP synthase [Chitinilyticum piscinae]MBE9607812.1 beta-ketoacyl-ACP synthase [Chitinilyticum piscinae]